MIRKQLIRTAIAAFILIGFVIGNGRGQGQPKAGEPLSKETLGKFLEDIGETARPLGKDGDRQYTYVIESKRSLEGRGWTLRWNIALNPDGTQLLIYGQYGIPNPDYTPSVYLANLLRANARTAPAYFSTDGNNLKFSMAIENRGAITPRSFRSQFQQFQEAYADQYKNWNVIAWAFPGLKQNYTGYNDGVRSVDVFPDGQRFVATTWGGSIQVRDRNNASPPVRMVGSKEGVLSVVVLPDGKSIITGEQNGVMREWDAATGTEKRRFEGHTHRIWTMALSRDGKRLASAGGALVSKGMPLDIAGKPTDKPDFVIRIWDLESGKEVKKLEGTKSYLNSVAFSPDGKKLVSAGGDDVMRIWDVEQGKELFQSPPLNGVIEALAVTPDGKVVSGGIPPRDSTGTYRNDQTIRIWDLETGKQLKMFGAHNIWTMSMLRDGKRILTSGPDKTLRLWDLDSGKELKVLAGHIEYVTTVAFTPDGQMAFSGSDDATVRLWDLAP